MFCMLYRGDVNLTNWTASQTTFPLTVKLLGLPDYSYHTILGLVVSVGGLTKSTVRDHTPNHTHQPSP